MVVPIRKPLESDGLESEAFQLVGFLCIDCVRSPDDGRVFENEHGQPDEDLRNLALAFSDMAFSIITKGQVCKAHGNGGACHFDESNLELFRFSWNDTFACNG